MKTAILTGASSGLGREFALRIRKAFPDIEEILLVARRAGRLEELAARIGGCRAVCAGLTKAEDIAALAAGLEEEHAEVRLLINCAGCGYLGAFADSEPAEQENMIRLNVLALTQVTRAVLPYMRRGARIINISSIASFVPNAYMTVYSATKAYVQSFSRALRYELKEKGIGVTAVCPGPMETEFLSIGRISGRSKTFDRLPYCKPAKVAAHALRSAKRGRSVYTPKLFYKFYHVIAHILPKAWLLPAART